MMVIFMGVLYIVLHPRFITLEQQLWCIEKKYACRPRLGKTLKNQIKMAALYQRPLSSILLIYASELKRIPLSGIFTPGHTRSPSRSSHRAPICAPSPMTQFLIRAFAPIRTPCPMMESSSTTPAKIGRASCRERV